MPFDFGSLFGKIGSVLGVQNGSIEVDPMLSAAQGWLVELFQHGSAKWMPFMLQGLACGVPELHGQCGQLAAAPCAICRLPTCLKHAMTAWNADVVCVRCMNTFAAMVADGRAQMPRPGARRPGVGEPPPPAPPPHAEDPVKLRKQHLRTLGLKDPTDAAEIKAAYKELARKHHPDAHEQGTAAQKQKNAEKFRAVTEAYQWLRAAEQKAA